MKYRSVLLLLVSVGCSAPINTEINRPSLDVNGTRQLLLRTSNNLNQTTIAYAAYSDSLVIGFGPDVVITCNSDTIVNTLRTTGGSDTERFIEESTIYIWSYQGPDTSFLFTMSSPGDEFIVTEPTDDTLIQPSPGDSLRILYEPAGPCPNLQVILGGFIAGQTADAVTPNIQFNPLTGTIAPISLDSIRQRNWEGDGTISIIKVSDSTFSLPSIHAITVKDSANSLIDEIRWED